MTIERKVGMGIAGQPSGATDVADVFSTYLYTGNGGTNAINNGIDLAGEGGMVWFKSRTTADNHYIVDTERGASKVLYGLGAAAETTSANSVTSFNSNGFTLGADDTDGINKNTRSQVSWTFRKKSGFFDCVTWTGNGVAGREIAHGLDGPVGMLVVKRTDSGGGWRTWHRSVPNKTLVLDETGAASTNSAIYYFGNDSSVVNPTSTNFTVGAASELNANGATYVAYLFADNSSEDADDQMIKCGSYTGNGSTDGPVVNLGWEPQWLLVKGSSSGGAGNWILMDTMRGMPVGDEATVLMPNSTSAESGTANLWGADPTPTGFKVNVSQSQMNASGETYIYMAIRSPMMVEPEAATDVFHANASQGAGGGASFYSTGFDVDMAITKITNAVGSHYNGSRLAGSGQFLRTENTNAEDSGGPFLFDVSDGVTKTGGGGNGNDPYVTYMWKRAKGYMDVVAFDGGGAGATVPHSLGVKPDLFIYKKRSGTGEWLVYNSVDGATYAMDLRLTAARESQLQWFNNTEPTSTVFTTGSKAFSGQTYIAYLFATLTGISKVGSFVGNGSSQTISCGFSAGSRYILIKRTDASGDWFFWDSVRGIVAGNDPHLSLNTTAAQVTTDDSVDPANAGFIVNQNSTTNINVSSGTYIFYAIA